MFESIHFIVLSHFSFDCSLVLFTTAPAISMCSRICLDSLRKIRMEQLRSKVFVENRRTDLLDLSRQSLARTPRGRMRRMMDLLQLP